MAILASAALTTDALYVPIFLLYLLTAVWTLLLYHLTQETGEIPVVVTPPSTAACRSTFPRRITHRFFWLTNGTAILTVALTLAIFFSSLASVRAYCRRRAGRHCERRGFPIKLTWERSGQSNKILRSSCGLNCRTNPLLKQIVCT